MKKKSFNAFMSETGLLNAVIIRLTIPAKSNIEYDTNIKQRGLLFLHHNQTGATVIAHLSQTENTATFTGTRADLFSNINEPSKICIYRKNVGENIFIKNNSGFNANDIQAVFLPLL